MSWFKTKVKAIASRASDAIAHAAEVVAPMQYASKVEELQYRWESILSIQNNILSQDQEPQEEQRLVKDSRLRESLDNIVHLLKEEEEVADQSILRSATLDARISIDYREKTKQKGMENGTETDDKETNASRPCLEYLLEKQILQQLCHAGAIDRPCGMHLLTLQFMRALFAHVHHPIILPTHGIYPSILQLIKSSIMMEPHHVTIRRHFFSLLVILWQKIHEDSCLLECFMAVESSASESHFIQNQKSLKDEATSNPIKEIPNLILFSSLLPYMYDPSIVGDRSRQSIIYCMSCVIQSDRLNSFILKFSPFCHDVITGLVKSFDELPRAKSIQGKEYSSDQIQSFNEAFCRRLQFCSTILMAGADQHSNVTSGSPSVYNTLLEDFENRFLIESLQPRLLETSEAVASTTTEYVMDILCTLKQHGPCSVNPLLYCISKFLFHRPFMVYKELVHRMNSLSDVLSICTMDFFSQCLELNDEWIMRMLIDSTLETEESESEETHIEDLNAQIKEKEQKESEEMIDKMDENQKENLPIVEANSPNMKTENISSTVQWFIKRFPDSEVSSHIHNFYEYPKAGSKPSFVAYLADAEYSATYRRIACEQWNVIQQENVSEDEEDSETEDDQKPSASVPSYLHIDCHRLNGRNLLNKLQMVSISAPSGVSTLPATRTGKQLKSNTLFFRVLYSRLERFLDHSLAENFALTQLLSLLAQSPEPDIHDLLFDTQEIYFRKDGIVSMRLILEEVWSEARKRLARISDVERQMEVCKRRLNIGNENSLGESSHKSMTGAVLTSNAPVDPFEVVRHQRFIEAYIVLEEFLKEITCILHAKDQLQRTPLKPEGFYMQPHDDKPRPWSPRNLSMFFENDESLTEEFPNEIERDNMKQERKERYSMETEDFRISAL